MAHKHQQPEFAGKGDVCSMVPLNLREWVQGFFCIFYFITSTLFDSTKLILEIHFLVLIFRTFGNS